VAATLVYSIVAARAYRLFPGLWPDLHPTVLASCPPPDLAAQPHLVVSGAVALLLEMPLGSDLVIMDCEFAF
jgi:hypothetical protein